MQCATEKPYHIRRRRAIPSLIPIEGCRGFPYLEIKNMFELSFVLFSFYFFVIPFFCLRFYFYCLLVSDCYVLFHNMFEYVGTYLFKNLQHFRCPDLHTYVYKMSPYLFLYLLKHFCNK